MKKVNRFVKVEQIHFHSENDYDVTYNNKIPGDVSGIFLILGCEDTPVYLGVMINDQGFCLKPPTHPSGSYADIPFYKKRDLNLFGFFNRISNMIEDGAFGSAVLEEVEAFDSVAVEFLNKISKESSKENEKSYRLEV